MPPIVQQGILVVTNCLFDSKNGAKPRFGFKPIIKSLNHFYPLFFFPTLTVFSTIVEIVVIISRESFLENLFLIIIPLGNLIC